MGKRCNSMSFAKSAEHITLGPFQRQPLFRQFVVVFLLDSLASPE